MARCLAVSSWPILASLLRMLIACGARPGPAAGHRGLNSCKAVFHLTDLQELGACLDIRDDGADFSYRVIQSESLIRGDVEQALQVVRCRSSMERVPVTS